MTSALLALVLLAPAPKKEWSKAHQIGIFVPNTWKVTSRDKEGRAFLIEGPKLGPGIPTAAIHFAGKADGQTLKQKTAELVKVIRKRPGWRVVAQARKRLGDHAAIRVGIAFNDEGRKGRARFTVVLLGSAFYVLEMNAAATHFPGSTFDAMERSLELPTTARKLESGLTLATPLGWGFDAAGGKCAVIGPKFGVGPPIVQIAPGNAPAQMLKGAKPGDKVRFLGTKQDTQIVEFEIEGGLKVRRLHVHTKGLTALITAPVSIWEDVLPTVEAILASVKLPKPADR